MRKKIIAGNWKMNADKQEAVALISALISGYDDFDLSENKVVVVAPPYPYIHYCSSVFFEYPFLLAAAQNCSEYEQGAYTGEVSAKIIASLDVTYVIIGHSERRQYFQENAEVLLKKLQQALHYELIPVFCCGEPLDVRENAQHFSYVKEQLESCLFQLAAKKIKETVIAYEPVWAIGTGVTASPEQAQEMHAYIRKLIAERYDEETAANISILYGGSVNEKNAPALFEEEDIDGGLVGGASLKAEEFAAIIKAMKGSS